MSAAPAEHLHIACAIEGCPAQGMWTRAGDLRVLCTEHDAAAQLHAFAAAHCLPAPRTQDDGP